MKIGTSTTYISGFYLPDSWDAKRTGAGQATQGAQNDRLTVAQESLQRLRSTHGAAASSRQDLMSKVGWLRQQLDALKAMLLQASPQQAKALAQELRGIASQLASIAKELGSSSGGQAVPSGTTAVAATTGESMPTEGNAGGAAATPSQTDQAAERKDTAPARTADQSNQESLAQGASPGHGENAALRGVLADAKQRLKEAAHMLKPKLAAAGKEAKNDMHAIEKSMLDIDSSLQQGSVASSYTGQGALVFDLGPAAVSGMTIDLTA